MKRNPPSIITGFDPAHLNALNAVFQDVYGNMGKLEKSITEEGIKTYVTGATLSALRVCKLDATGTLVYGDGETVGDMFKIFGITVTAANLGASSKVREYGEMEDSSWAWTLGTPIFCGASGVLTQTPPAAFRRIVAEPLTDKKIAVKFLDPIKKAV